MNKLRQQTKEIYHLQVITGQPAYEGKSQEELRLEDYRKGLRGPSAPGGDFCFSFSSISNFFSNKLKLCSCYVLSCAIASSSRWRKSPSARSKPANASICTNTRIILLSSSRIFELQRQSNSLRSRFICLPLRSALVRLPLRRAGRLRPARTG